MDPQWVETPESTVWATKSAKGFWLYTSTSLLHSWLHSLVCAFEALNIPNHRVIMLLRR